MNKTFGIILSVVGVLIVIAAWFLFTTPKAQAPVSEAPQAETIPSTATAPSSTVASMNGVVEYSANGFSPSTVTIKQGGTVTFTSGDGSQIWIASNAHPTHTEYDGTSRDQHCVSGAGTSFDQCAPGTSYTFTFSKVGTWGFHNHLSPNNMGTVVVVQ